MGWGMSMHAWADAGNAAPNPMSQWIMFGAFGAIFYFLIWRPQSKRAKSHQTLLAGLQKDDEILTNGGILGRVVKVGDDFVTVIVSDDQKLHLQKQAIAMAVPKGTLRNAES